VYCYAGCLARGRGETRQWGSFVEVRTNFVERLVVQLRRSPQGTVLLSTLTDPYQVTEEHWGLAARCLTVCAPTALGVSILTKSDLVLRDVGLLRPLAKVVVGFSFTTVDDGLAAVLEPGAPPPSRRLTALRELTRAGIGTWVFVAPVIPGLNDNPGDLARIVRAVHDAGVRDVDFDPFNFYPSAVSQVREVMTRYRTGNRAVFDRACQNPAVYRKEVRRGVRGRVLRTLVRLL